MSSRYVTLSLAVALAGVSVFALLRDDFPRGAVAAASAPTAAAAAPMAPASASDPASDPPSSDLPAEHVHGASTGTLSAADLTAPDEAPALEWKTPSAWKSAPNPSALRIATYKVPHAPADAEDADVSVVRAGGTADANIERWRDQFEGSVKETRTAKTVRGLKVSIVEITGTYLGGSGGSVTSRPGWTLVGAIVETPRLPYFFKMTGATATVRSSRAAFDALVESLSTPASR